MPRQSSAAAKGDASKEIEVDTDQADLSKAVNRQAEPEERPNRGNAMSSESDDDGKDLSWVDKNRAFQKRLRRLNRSFDQKLANEQAERQRERRELQEEIASLRVNRPADTSASDEAHKAELDALQAQLEAAHEAGNSKEVARINRVIAEKIGAHSEAKTQAYISGQRREAEKMIQTHQKAPAAGKGGTKASRFIAQTEWWGDPEFEAEQAYANSLFARYTNEEGIDPESDGLFKRINRQLKKKFPTLEVNELQSDDDDSDDEDSDEGMESRNRRPAAVQNFKDRGAEPSSRRQSGTRLTAEDMKNMREMRMDPNDDKAVLAYARAKREMEEAEQ